MATQFSPPKSRVFVGSSSEANPVVQALIEKLSSDADIVPWWKSPEFKPMTSILSGLLEAVSKGVSLYDFGLFVLTPDDLVRSRGKESRTPRDNVLFELGLFLGAFGPDRTFATLQLAAKNSDKLKTPSDFQGIIIPTFSAPHQKEFDETITNVAESFRQFIKKGPRPLKDKLVHIQGFSWDFLWKPKVFRMELSEQFLHKNKLVLEGKKLVLVSLVTDPSKNIDRNRNIAVSLPREFPQILQDITIDAPDQSAKRNIFSSIKRGTEVQGFLYAVPTGLDIKRGMVIKDLLANGGEKVFAGATNARPH